MLLKKTEQHLETRKVISACEIYYVLAQMARDPYLVFFNHFNEENNWRKILKEEDIPFVKQLLSSFLTL